MNANEMEHREIGELISELDSREWDLGIDVDDSTPQRRVFVRIGQRRINHEVPQTRLDGMEYEGDSIAEALSQAVDAVRRERGEPSLAEEVRAMIYKEEEHAALPPIFTGPDASCRCGSRAPLIVERKVKVEFPWDGSQPRFDPVFGIMGIAGPACAGEIGRCPDCGLWYQLRA